MRSAGPAAACRPPVGALCPREPVGQAPLVDESGQGRRVAIVTGTSSGIGVHTAVGLAHAGLHVVATMREPTRAGRLRAAAADAGVEVEVRRLDVTDPVAAERCVRAVTNDHGGVDVLVNNAGRGHVATLEETTDADLVEQLAVNYLAVARLTRLVLPGMRATGAGRVVTVTSVAAWSVSPSLTPSARPSSPSRD
jgi:short-subunit dehydrogenase